jgi:hypothetical protein
VKKWSAALGSTTTPGELTGLMTRERFREIVRATAPLLDTVQHLRLYVMFACANPRLGDRSICVELQDSSTKWPHVVATKAAPALRLSDSALGVVFGTQSDDQLISMLRVIETVNAMSDGVFALAAPLVVTDPPVMQNVGWHQTENDFRALRECEAQARSFGLRSRPAPVASSSLALYPDQCAMVCASMRDCANGDDLVTELLLGPDAKMNWDPTSSHPDFYRIAQPTAHTVSRQANVTTNARYPDSVAEARSKTHFGDSTNPNPLMRPSYPERSTQLMTAEEVRIANDQQSVGRPSLRATKPAPIPAPQLPPAPVRLAQPPLTKTTTSKNKQGKTAAAAAAAAAGAKPKGAPQPPPPPPPSQALPQPQATEAAAAEAAKRKAPTQFNGFGRVVKPKPPGAEEARSGNHKRTRDLPLTAGMLDFMLMNEP